MKMTEESMKVLEAGIPKLAQGAFQRAHYQALTTSGKVMRAVNGQLVETHADGTEKVVRTIHSPVKVAMGAKFKLKPRVTAAG
ncbi:MULTISPECIES: hypothetical protein [Acidovorax]|uniref:Uncharacterized protein n=1 Tax=Acidovorax soli TaxID=592050 RepID=A0A1H4ANS9_9BURK|nr:hypothetical protein [Acidovorax soli]MCM2348154.1 hypothetical protein [Acidovorax soli]SEA37314.1 hypothetical protein SAMN05421875_11112 [Acidovorax soli]